MTSVGQSYEETFADVFYALGIPLLAVDMWAVREAIESGGSSGHSTVVFPLPPSDRQPAARAGLHGFFDSVRVPPDYARFLSTSAALRDSPAQQVFLESCASVQFFPSDTEHGVVWAETTLWPIAYEPQLEQLMALMAARYNDFAQRRHEDPSVTQLSEAPRTLPTRLHYAFASLADWLGGARNLGYFGLAATDVQIADSAANLQYAYGCGYTDDDARELDASGLIAVPADFRDMFMGAQGAHDVFGSIPPDEPNMKNVPALPDLTARARLNGLIVDKNYRASFSSRALGGGALYGASDVLRDHYDDFYAELEPAFLLRCKHYCAPVVEVGSLDEIRALVARIPDFGGVVFRGQSKLFCLPRTDRVKQLLFGDSCSTEPSLSSSASRSGFDYDELHFALRYYLTERILERGDGVLLARWRAAVMSPMCELDYALMALAQHYGLPTHGLDVTTDLDVAAWFATNALSIAEDGTAAYAAADWPDSPDDWPVLFAHLAVTHSIEPSLQDCQELDEFGFVAQRPSRQRARFFLGGHSDHQNRLAETVVCAFRLRPGDYTTALTFEELFPSPEEDAAYRALLAFADSWPTAAGRVLRFH